VSEVLCTGKTRLSVHGWLHSAPTEQRLRYVEPLSQPLTYVDIEVSTPHCCGLDFRNYGVSFLSVNGLTFSLFETF